ncbi:FtsX-like permease family protein [Luminiphilus sp.]|nr:FtsX-like permease family protein [Luminiphilus sp.]
MPWSERISFALRQVLDRGRGLSGFLSRLSVVGLTLAVAILLAVLAVMNGFEREMRERILGVVPHVSIQGFADLEAWNALQAQSQRAENVTDSSLFYERDLLAVQGEKVTAAKLLGVTASVWQRWEKWSKPMGVTLEPGDVVLGIGLARRLQVALGDQLRVIVPGDDFTSNTLPVTDALRVVALVDSGTELDEGLMLANFEYTATLLGDELTATGLALQLGQLFEAPRVRWDFARTLSPSFYVTDWTLRHGNLYAAIRLSRDLVTLLLLSIIAVAAFNVVSSLVLVVIDRRGFIAMLQAMGASRQDILWIFLFQGLWIGVLGASAGLLLGVGLAQLIPVIASGLEWLLDGNLLNTDVYPLNFLPIDIRVGDALWLWCTSVVLCLVAAVVPARRAMRVPIAQALATQ